MQDQSPTNSHELCEEAVEESVFPPIPSATPLSPSSNALNPSHYGIGFHFLLASRPPLGLISTFLSVGWRL